MAKKRRIKKSKVPRLLASKGHRNPIDAHIGDRIRLCRLLRGVSQRALGDSIGVTFQQVQKYERGIVRVSCSRLARIAKALNTPVPFFFADMSPNTAYQVPSRVRRLGLAPEFDRLDRLFHSHDTLKVVCAFCRIPNQSTRISVANLVKALARSAARDASY